MDLKGLEWEDEKAKRNLDYAASLRRITKDEAGFDPAGLKQYDEPAYLDDDGDTYRGFE